MIQLLILLNKQGSLFVVRQHSLMVLDVPLHCGKLMRLRVVDVAWISGQSMKEIDVLMVQL